MKQIQYTLLADGPSDRALRRHLNWLLLQNGIDRVVDSSVVDNTRLPKPVRKWPHSPLAWRIRQSLDLYPCDLLFVHRDAEKEPMEHRVQEITQAVSELAHQIEKPAICVVPVRMQEAWLLFDEQAIRHAAGNPNGRVPLNLPRLRTIEDLPDPKQALHGLLKTASGLQGRRLKNISLSNFAQRVADFIEDFSPLRELTAFRELELQIIRHVAQQD